MPYRAVVYLMMFYTSSLMTYFITLTALIAITHIKEEANLSY